MQAARSGPRQNLSVRRFWSLSLASRNLPPGAVRKPRKACGVQDLGLGTGGDSPPPPPLPLRLKLFQRHRSRAPRAGATSVSLQVLRLQSIPEEPEEQVSQVQSPSGAHCGPRLRLPLHTGCVPPVALFSMSPSQAETPQASRPLLLHLA